MDRPEMISNELRVVSCYFKIINVRVVSCFLQVAVLKNKFTSSKLNFTSCIAALRVEIKNL